MNYPLSAKYDTPELMRKIMGPNPLKLEEELLLNHRIPAGSHVMDLGSGQGLTSVFLAREYGFKVCAADLWSNPEDNRRFFAQMGLTDAQVLPVKADATALPFEPASFDAVVSIDSYHYFGRDPNYLDEKLLPFVREGGYLYIAIPGMKRDLHENLPPELLLSWTPEDLSTMHDAAYWRALVSRSRMAEVIEVSEMVSNEEVWADWLRQDNPYAIGDRKSMGAGGGRYLNFVKIVLRKKPAQRKDTVVLYVHGQGGSAAEAEHYRPLFPQADVEGFDYRAQTPWEAREEFSEKFARLHAQYSRVILIANSIGAFFSMQAEPTPAIDRAYFISPIVSMEHLIRNMMTWAGVTEDMLKAQGRIPTGFGDDLSWAYLQYVRQHPIAWPIPTQILYGSTDNLQSLDVLRAFAAQGQADITVMEGGEHWFHTPEQMAFLDRWICGC